jgi:tRNA 2-thiouridine synthesizing protein E
MGNEEVNEWGVETVHEAKFELDEAAVRQRAAEEGIELTGEHLGVLKIIHQFLVADTEDEQASVRELTRALQEQFEEQGGKRHLYELFPGGPIHQGCKLLGIEEPSGSLDLSFGSVH